MPPMGQGNLHQLSGMASDDSVPHSMRLALVASVVVVVAVAVVSVEVVAIVIDEEEGEMVVVQELILAWGSCETLVDTALVDEVEG